MGLQKSCQWKIFGLKLSTPTTAAAALSLTDAFRKTEFEEKKNVWSSVKMSGKFICLSHRFFLYLFAFDTAKKWNFFCFEFFHCFQIFCLGKHA
jgi:hypothetical protein